MLRNPAHVVVIGASGRVGGLLARYALQAGLSVTAAARDIARLAPLQQAAGAAELRTTVIDVLDPASVSAAVQGAEVVLSALAAPSLERPGATLSDGMRNLVDALERHAPAARVLCIAGAGILPAPGGGMMLDLETFPDLYRAMSREHARAWAHLRDSTLEWTVVCPPDMPSGERTRRYRTAAERMPEGGVVISAEDVADFMVREAMERRYTRVRVGLAY